VLKNLKQVVILLLNMAHRKQGYRFKNDWTMEEAEHRVLNLKKVKEYLSKAYQIAHLDCFCREKRHNCDAPLDVCIYLNDRAELALKSEEFKYRNPKKATMEEALDALARSHEASLVHMAYAYEQDEINVICSCCSCCCEVLSGILRFGLAPHLLTSYSTSVTDKSKCTDSGICVERCQFGAREIVNNKLAFNPDLCFGCGLCVSTCPTDAIKLIDK